MAKTEASSKDEKAGCEDLKRFAEVKRHLQESIAENKKLGELLAR